MIIKYIMANKSKYVAGWINRVEMCGQFRNLDHFKRFQSVEESYNRFILRYDILKGEES